MATKLNEFLTEKKQLDSKLNTFLTEKQHFDFKLDTFLTEKKQLDSKLNEFLSEKKQLDSKTEKQLDSKTEKQQLELSVDLVESKEVRKVLYFDGASKGNPGSSGAGAVLYSGEKEIGIMSYFVGKHETNNVAEYNGLIIGLELAIKEGVKKLLVRGDSKLIICQMKGEWKVKAKNLLPFYKTCKKFEKEFDEVIYEHVYRKDNKRADELANIGVELG